MDWTLKAVHVEKKTPIYFIDFLSFFHLHLIKINTFFVKFKSIYAMWLIGGGGVSEVEFIYHALFSSGAQSG